MRNMLAFLAVVALAVTGTGWYLGWFSVQSVPSSSLGQRSYTVDVNTSKITTDLHNAEGKIEQKLEKSKGMSSPAAPDAATTPPAVARHHHKHRSDAPTNPPAPIGPDLPEPSVPVIQIDR